MPVKPCTTTLGALKGATVNDHLDDWQTMDRSITLVNFQLDAQILIYLYIIHLLKSSTCFEHCPAHLQEVYVVLLYMQPLVSSLCR